MTSMTDWLADSYRAARAGGFPAFAADIHQSNNMNSSPYVTDLDGFIRDFSQDDTRKRMMGDFLSILNECQGCGIKILSIMIGGSFIRHAASVPKDLDGVLFYAVQDERADIPAFAGIIANAKSHGMDLRAIPVDVDPNLLIRAAAFFAMLYSVDRSNAESRRGVVLIQMKDAAEVAGKSRDAG